MGKCAGLAAAGYPAGWWSMSRRVSLDEDAVSVLLRENEYFGTSDLSKLIIAICAQRNLLIQICSAAHSPKLASPATSGDATLDELSGLLDN